MILKALFAYSFKAELSLEEIFARLNAVGPWTWVMRDSEHWGDYISTLALGNPDYAMVKIYVEPDHFVVNTIMKSDRVDVTAELSGLRAALFERVLPAIGARDLTPTDTYD